MTRDQHISAHPDFPWLAVDDPAAVDRLLHDLDWSDPDESLTACDRAGEGNMNLTLRVVTPRRSRILKQARPWVEKYDHIDAPWDRILFEQRFYHRAATLPDVARRMPKLLAADADTRTLLLEDLPAARDLTTLYAGDQLLDTDTVDELARYAAALHAGTAGTPDPDFANRDMRALNHAHLFVVPLDSENGIDLESLEPGLTAAAEALRADDAYLAAVRDTADRYLADGPVLLHGDYFPGSWLHTAVGLRIIDPEFCFYGDPEWDLGCAVAHFALARQPAAHAHRILNTYADLMTSTASPRITLDPDRLARYAAVEVMRRLIGVAQLPIAPTTAWRAPLLDRSRHTMLTARWESLWK